MNLYLYRAAQVIQNEGSRTGCCKSVGFGGRVAYGELISHLAHQPSELGRVHLAGQRLQQSRQHRRVSLGEPLLCLGSDR